MNEHLSAGWQLAQGTALSPTQTSRRQFFFTTPAQARNVWHAYAPVCKLGVVLSADQPWEEGNAASFCGSIVRIDNGGYRMYYTVSSLDRSTMGIALAESSDGVVWVRPLLGQYLIDGQDTNRIVIENLLSQERIVQPQVVRLPDGRWRMYFWRHQPGNLRYLVAHSEDGLRWQAQDPPLCVLIHSGVLGRESHVNGWMPATGDDTEIAEQIRLKGLRTNDASYIYYNEYYNRFEYYAPWLVPAMPDRRVEVDNAPFWHRYIHRRFSADGLEWSAPELIIMPDACDPWDQQFYYLAVQWHEDWMIGSLGHYRVEDGQQTQDLELVFSRDGRTWHRPVRGGFIPRSPETSDAWDSLGIYAPNAWIDEGETWLCLYTGTHLPHNQSRDPTNRPRPIMGARWAKDRFVGLRAGRVAGGFLSEPFYPQGASITVDADVHGWLRAELCDVFGRKHEGYHLMDAVPVIGDERAHVLRWEGVDTSRFCYDAVRLRFEWVDGEVYSIGF